MGSQDAIKQLEALVDEIKDPALNQTYQNVHQGYPIETLIRFLKARDWNVPKAHKMLLDSLNWRIQSEIDKILGKPIVPTELYRSVRDTQLVGLSGYSKAGLPVFAIGVGQSTYDKASVHYYVQSHIQLNEYRDRHVLPYATKKYGRHIGTCIKILDMSSLKISQLSQIKLLTVISTIDDLNYPEKTDTYYIANAPYIFSSCWKIVKPLLQERTRRKVQVLQGCGKDELLKIMDYESLPHFCRKEGSGSSRGSTKGSGDCFSLDHEFHQQMYAYMKQQSPSIDRIALYSQGSFHVALPKQDAQGSVIVQTIESELSKLKEQNGLERTISDLKINGV